MVGKEAIPEGEVFEPVLWGNILQDFIGPCLSIVCNLLEVKNSWGRSEMAGATITQWRKKLRGVHEKSYSLKTYNF
jgi:hypothetical protein